MNGCKSSEKIMDALDLLDTDLAEEVAKLREKKKKRPILWRYGALAACLALVLFGAVKLAPLLGHRVEEAPAVDGLAPENMGTEHSGTDGTGGYVPTVSENEDITAGTESKKPEAGEENESRSDEAGGASDDEESLGEGAEGIPGDEPLPALNLRIEGYDGDTVVCTVVDNEGCTFYPVGSVVVLRFDIWEGEPVTEISFTPGSVWSIMFNGDERNFLFAVDGYEVEE